MIDRRAKSRSEQSKRERTDLSASDFIARVLN